VLASNIADGIGSEGTAKILITFLL
ncbi:uncharacterized protein METZ01_LOCUS80574, partial [marine metagenome]